MAVHSADILAPAVDRTSSPSAGIVLDRVFGFVPTTTGLVSAGRLKRGMSVWNGQSWSRVLRCQHGAAVAGVRLVTRSGYELYTEPTQFVVMETGVYRVSELRRGQRLWFRPFPLGGTQDPDGVWAIAVAGSLACRIPPSRTYRAPLLLIDALRRVRQCWERLLGSPVGIRLLQKLDTAVLKLKPETATRLGEVLRQGDSGSSCWLEGIGRGCPSSVALFLAHWIGLACQLRGSYLELRVHGQREGILLHQLLLAFAIPTERRMLEANTQLRIAWHRAYGLQELMRCDTRLHLWVQGWRRHARYDYHYGLGEDAPIEEWLEDVAYLQPCTLRPIYVEVDGGRIYCNGFVISEDGDV